ncbi:TIGR02147 family protein [Bdellovibrio sp. HCB337]|uniref:TIGR02147 family protein n=1 Tax=Bdellovibrio sp. HCB337 TaxID=3394358 RepID=UPI0039A72BCA
MEATKAKRSQTRRNFRNVLQDELTLRCSRNPNYSLRSFAKALQISPSALSAMLSGKRPITDKMKERLGLKLGLSLSELKRLHSQPHGNSKLKNTDGIEGSFQQITVDTFAIISEPYHYALLELMKTEGFEEEPRWIAQRLQITVSEVKFALERLERVGLIERDEKGVLTDATEGFSTDIRDGLTSQAQRRFQENSLRHAMTSVQTVPLEKRDNTSMTMAINSADLPKARKMLKTFRRRFCKDLESAPRLNEVYQLTMAFVPITNTK